MDSYMQLLSGHNVNSSQIWGEDSQLASPPEEQEVEEVQVVGATSFVKPSKKRTKNFSEKEDILLVLAWLEISTDATQGNEQPRATYWQRIHDYFHEHKKFESDRSSNSLTHRWQTILESVNRFCGWYAQIQNRRQSGVTEQDKVQQACDLYKARDKQNKSFGFLHCWNILQHEQKWMDRCSLKKQKTTTNASPGTSTPGTNKSRHDEVGECHTSPPKDARPDGKKKEKERQRRGKNSTSQGENLYMDALENMWAKKKEAEELKEIKKKERDDMFVALEQKKLEEKMALENKKLELKEALETKKLALKEKELNLRKTSEDEKVINMDLSGMSELQQQYYKGRQEEIIAQRFGAGAN